MDNIVSAGKNAKQINSILIRLSFTEVSFLFTSTIAFRAEMVKTPPKNPNKSIKNTLPQNKERTSPPDLPKQNKQKIHKQKNQPNKKPTTP